MSYRIRIRRDTLANWQSNNPTLGIGEVALVTDTTPQRLKFGDGLARFNSLPFFTLPAATTSEAGIMSASDKAKLNGIDASAVNMNKVVNMLGRTVGEAVRFTFEIPADNTYTLLNSDSDLLLLVSDGVGYITSTKACAQGTEVVSLVFSDASTIPANVAKNKAMLTGVHIPSWVHRIGTSAFDGTAIKDVVCEGVTPPACDATVFENVDLSGTTLHVHEDVRAAYENHLIWGTFGAIENI